MVDNSNRCGNWVSGSNWNDILGISGEGNRTIYFKTPIKISTLYPNSRIRGAGNKTL
jgi:hypothetical protein